MKRILQIVAAVLAAVVLTACVRQSGGRTAGIPHERAEFTG